MKNDILKTVLFTSKTMEQAQLLPKVSQRHAIPCGCIMRIWHKVDTTVNFAV